MDALNSAYPGLVMLHERRMPFAERVSLFASSDMLVNAAVRHGLNLVPFEFVLCGSDKHPGFVVSEFLGCSRVMPGAPSIACSCYSVLWRPACCKARAARTSCPCSSLWVLVCAHARSSLSHACSSMSRGLRLRAGAVVNV